MKTKIFTLISTFSFAISSAECSEKMINNMGQSDSDSIEYGYNDTGVEIVCEENLYQTPVMNRTQGLPKTPDSPIVHTTERDPIRLQTPPSFSDVEGSIDPYKAFNPISFDKDLEEDIYKTPVMERRQGLPKTPPSPGKKSPSDVCVKKHKISKKSKYERRNRILVWDDVERLVNIDESFDLRVLTESDFITPVKTRIEETSHQDSPLASSVNVTPVKTQDRSFDDQIFLQRIVFTPAKRLKRAVYLPLTDEERKRLCRRLFQ